MSVADNQDSMLRSIRSSQRVLLLGIIDCLTIVSHPELGTATTSPLGDTALHARDDCSHHIFWITWTLMEASLLPSCPHCHQMRKSYCVFFCQERQGHRERYRNGFLSQCGNYGHGWIYVWTHPLSCDTALREVGYQSLLKDTAAIP
jgi:hypothetical protein